MGNIEEEEGKRTNKFFNCTNTLGALTTAIVLLPSIPSNNLSAKIVAVSSEYYVPFSLAQSYFHSTQSSPPTTKKSLIQNGGAIL